MGQEFPSLNQIESSWAEVSCGFDIDGGELIDETDIAAIKFDDKVSVGTRVGLSGGLITGSTAGSVESNLSITFYRAGLRKLKKGLIKKAPLRRGNQRAISLVFWNLILQSTPVGDEDIYEHRFKSCRLLGNSYDLKEGSDADKIEVPCFVTQIAELIDGEEIVLL